GTVSFEKSSDSHVKLAEAKLLLTLGLGCSWDTKLIKHLSIDSDGLKVSDVVHDFHGYKVFDADNLLHDRLGRLIDVIKRSAAATGRDVVNTVFQIVLVIVVMSEKSSRHVIFLEHGDECSDVRIITLASRHCRKRRMMRYHESETRFLMGL